MGREADAKRDFEESIRLCPGNSWAYYNRGIAVYRLGDAGETRRLMELALSVSDPPLTKRKRERARALLERLPVPPMDAPAGCERQ